MKKIIVTFLAIAAILMLFGCEKKLEYIETEHDVITVHFGETVKLELTNIPEGYTSAQYQWGFGINTGVSVNTVLDGEGNFTADNSGEFVAYATLTVDDKRYHEKFLIEVPAHVDVLSLDQAEMKLLPEMQEQLTVLIEGDFFISTPVEWSSSDEAVATVEPCQRSSFMLTDIRCIVTTHAPGEAVVSVTMGGKTASCTVTVLKADIETYRYLREQGKLELLKNNFVTTDIETLKFLVEQGEYELVARNLFTCTNDDIGYANRWSDDTPAEMKDAYAYPVDLFLELYSGQETMLDAEGWQKLCGFGLLPSDEFAASLGRLRQLAPALKPQQAETPNDNEVISWKNAVNAEQFAALGTEMADKVIVLWTVGEPYMGAGSWMPRPMAMANAPYNTDSITRAILDDGMAAVADCGETLQLPASQLPERIEEVEYVIELKVSSVQDDTKYYYSDTGKLADDVAVYKTRVYCTLYKLTDGEWAQLYDAGYTEGEMPNSDFYETKLVAGYSPTYAQLSALVRDAENHLPS